MSNLELLQNLEPDTVNSLLSQTTLFSEKPNLVQKWHVVISSPLIGQQHYQFDNLDSLRREISKSVDKLVLGSIHIFLGYAMPITTDSSGKNLFTVDLDGNEIALTNGYHERNLINNEEFGVPKSKIEIDKLI